MSDKMESFQNAFASIAELGFWWPTHTRGHDKYVTFKTLMESRHDNPDEVIWFLLTYVFDLEKRFSALRMAVAKAADDAEPNSKLVRILAREEQELNGSSPMPDHALGYWENMARIAGAQMRGWAERVNPDDKDEEEEEK